MSHLSHATRSLGSRAHRAAWVAALLALAATIAVVLVVSVGGSSSAAPADSVGVRSAWPYSYGGPSESSVAAAVSGQRSPRAYAARPDEGRTATP
jgi:hypothetical protein